LELRPLLRGGACDDALAAAIRQAVERKPLSHDFDALGPSLVRFMSKTGG
ncbi:GTP 3',8-cyclase MoaA, partial [Chromobacterium alticapitis]